VGKNPQIPTQLYFYPYLEGFTMLTNTQIRNAKPREKLYKLPDERGLQLVVFPTGSKLWQMRYRFETKDKTASLGDLT